MALRNPPRLLLVLGLLAGAAAAGAVSLTISGSTTYTFVLDATSLTPPATPGADYAVQISPSNTMEIEIKHSVNDWRLEVCKTDDPDWENVTLEIRRTSNGNGSGTLSPDLGWLTLDTAYRTLFTCQDGDRKGIRLQLQLTASVHNTNVKIYSNRLSFRLTDRLNLP